MGLIASVIPIQYEVINSISMVVRWQLLWDIVMRPIAESIPGLQKAVQQVHSTVLWQPDMESNKDYEIKKFLLEQMEGESDDAHLERLQTIQEYWDSFEQDEPIAS